MISRRRFIAAASATLASLFCGLGFKRTPRIIRACPGADVKRLAKSMRFGDTLILCEGTHRVRDTICMPEGTTLAGEGQDKTKVELDRYAWIELRSHCTLRNIYVIYDRTPDGYTEPTFLCNL